MSRCDVLCLLVVLAACAAPEAPPTPGAAAAGTAAAPGAAATDGRYTGRWAVEMDRTGQCNSPALPDTALVLRDGQATLANPQMGATSRGSVTPGGDVLVSGSVPGLGPFTFRGRVQGDRVLGELANPLCVFRADLRRAA